MPDPLTALPSSGSVLRVAFKALSRLALCALTTPRQTQRVNYQLTTEVKKSPPRWRGLDQAMATHPHKMNLAKRLTALACVLMLPGCCVFGFERAYTLEWVSVGLHSPTPSPTVALEDCTAPLEQACAQTTHARCQQFLDDPSSMTLRSASSGRVITGEAAIQRQTEYCQDLLAQHPRRERMHCPGHSDAIERCMVAKGFVQQEQPHLRCSALKVF